MERALSANEARVILDLEWRGQKTVTLAEIREALGASEGYAAKLAHGLVRKGWLERLRPGLFQLVPASRGREGVADMNPLAAGSVLMRPYFYSFATACTHHGLTEQFFAEVYLACLERRRPRSIRDKLYVFVRVPKRRFFGFEEARILGHPVQMATVERALLDAVDRPRYAGGIGEVSRIVARGAERISWNAIVGLARRWRSGALVQRLGYLVDLHGSELPDRERTALLDLVRPESKVLLGPRGKWGTSGRLVRPWNVVENVPSTVLLPGADRPRKRVTFPRKEQDR